MGNVVSLYEFRNRVVTVEKFVDGDPSASARFAAVMIASSGDRSFVSNGYDTRREAEVAARHAAELLECRLQLGGGRDDPRGAA